MVDSFRRWLNPQIPQIPEPLFEKSV